MTIHEVCQRLGKSESTIRRWIREGTLTATKVNGVWDISEEMVNDCSNGGQTVGSDQSVDGTVQQLRSENDYLKERIQELESARERSDTLMLQLTRQLEQSQRMLEAHSAPWWRRLRRRRKTAGEQ